MSCGGSQQVLYSTSLMTWWGVGVEGWQLPGIQMLESKIIFPYLHTHQ